MPYFLHRFLSNCLLGAMFMINAIQDLIEEFDGAEELYEYLEYAYIGLEDVLVEELGWEVKDEI